MNKRKPLLLIGICSLFYGFLESKIFHLPQSVRFWSGLERNEKKRISSAPFLSGDTFRSMCDHAFDEVKTFLDTSLINAGDSIFLVAGVFPYFFEEVYPNISVPIVLVSHNNDSDAPGEFARYLDDDKILAWFTVNADRDHEKLIPIPIGLANRYWPHGDIKIVQDVLEEGYDKDILFYAGFASNTHPSRAEVYAYFKNVEGCSFSSKKSFKNYFIDVASSKFVLSPRGNGEDCHRTWEALYAGAVPIVLSSSIDKVFEGLPVLIVDDWKDVSKEYLLQKWSELNTKKFNFEAMNSAYWQEKIREYKKNKNYL